MSGEEVWDSLPTFRIRPKKTFFGLDKSGGHCFTLRKEMTDQVIRFFGLREGRLQREITLVLDEREYPAIVRWIRMDRRRPSKLKPGDLPARDLVQFDWRSHEITQTAMRVVLQDAFEQIRSVGSNTTQSALFVHVRENVFCLHVEN